MNISIPRFCRQTERASFLLKSMANPHRLLILCQLKEGPVHVGALEDLTGLTQSALSQHLARLRKDGLVKTQRQAQTISYSLADPIAARLLETLYDLYCGNFPSRSKKGPLS